MRLERVHQVRHDDGTVVVELPGGHLDRRTALELVDQFLGLREDRSVAAVVLGSRDADFCTGAAADLDVLELSPDPAAALATIRRPVLAAIRGRCSSVGLEIVLAADIRIAAPDAVFALPDVIDGGFPAWGGTQRLSRVVRPSFAAQMVLTGCDVHAERALELGLVHEIDPDPTQRVQAIRERIATIGGLAAEFAKEAVHRGAELPLASGLRLEGDLNHLLASTEDRAEGIRAFLAKRPPDFTGR